MSSDIAWTPTPEVVERANTTRLMRAHDIATFEELRRRSVQDIGWFWDAVVADLDIRFTAPYSRVFDDSAGVEWTRWFVDGRINLAQACVDRWADESGLADRPAVVAEDETGAVRSLTYRQLRDEVDALAAALRAHGIGRGDSVAIYLPMVPEAVIAMYAVAKIGAVAVPLFSGFGAVAVAARLRDARAKVLLTADGMARRGKVIDLKTTVDRAVPQAASVEKVVVLDVLAAGAPLCPGRDVSWAEFVAPHLGSRFEAADTAAEDPVLIAYTSGTTGAPKGAVHVHGGFLVKIAAEAAYQTDVRPGDVLSWITDMGWIMGSWAMIGAHANGATLVMLDGAVDRPDPARLWRAVENHRINALGVSPTLVRALKRHGPEWPARADLSTLRILAIAGEPCDAGSYNWLREISAGRCPIINFSGGTEVGACFLSAHPVESLSVGSLGGPALGMDVDVLDAAGAPVRGGVGELTCSQPWPGMTRGIWNDPQRYLESYWSTYPGIWRHGDWARIAADGQWYLLGRSDDAMNIAGKRVAPGEVEAILLEHPAVVEAAAVGVHDADKGEALWCFVVADANTELPAELAELIVSELGKPYSPARVLMVRALPKTTSGKILRRALRALAQDSDPGEMSSAENPAVIDEIRAALVTGGMQ